MLLKVNKEERENTSQMHYIWYLQKNTYLQEHMIMKQQKRPIAFYSVTTKNLCLPHKNSDVIHNNGMLIAVGFPDPHYLVIILN